MIQKDNTDNKVFKKKFYRKKKKNMKERDRKDKVLLILV